MWETFKFWMLYSQQSSLCSTTTQYSGCTIPELAAQTSSAWFLELRHSWEWFHSQCVRSFHFIGRLLLGRLSFVDFVVNLILLRPQEGLCSLPACSEYTLCHSYSLRIIWRRRQRKDFGSIFLQLSCCTCTWCLSRAGSQQMFLSSSSWCPLFGSGEREQWRELKL